MRKIIRFILYYTHYPLLLLIKKCECDKTLFKNKNYIIAANHSSILDPILLTMFFYHKYDIWVRFLSAEKNYRNPINCLYLYSFSSIKIEDDRRHLAIPISVNLLNKGENIGIFPEGGRVLNRKSKIKTGVIRIAASSGKDILPLRIIGTDKMLPPRKFFPKFKKSTIIVGKPISIKRVFFNESNYANLKRESKRVMNQVYSLK